MNPYYYYYPRGYQNDRFDGPILPFLAGVLVTTPFIFLNKNQPQVQPYYPPQPYIPYNPYMPYRPY